MDFSHYATPDPEFATLLEQMGGPAALQLPKGLSPVELRSTINAQRVQFSQEIVAKLRTTVLFILAEYGLNFLQQRWSLHETLQSKPQTDTTFQSGSILTKKSL